MKSSVKLHLFEQRESLHVKLATRIAEALRLAINERGRAFVAFSGGSTPRPMLEQLSSMELDWEKVTVTLVDERWVDMHDVQSNERMLRESLLRNNAAEASFLGLKSDEATPYEAEAACCARFDAMRSELDVAVLGMGNDGHTASFFPEAQTLSKALRSQQSCVALTPPHAPCMRMTLSFATLSRSRHLLLHIEGDEKWRVYSRALQPGSVESMPIRAFLRAETAKKTEVFYAA
ncbi:MAG: 6-phosphogluconolactonase [Campylobacterales bacterium]|nr:6-phosphogluconolactonase [Campylobacterales bacterium]